MRSRLAPFGTVLRTVIPTCVRGPREPCLDHVHDGKEVDKTRLLTHDCRTEY